MPELPEVETIRRDLEERIVGLKIKDLSVKDKKLGKNKDFTRFLINKKVLGLERVGKLLSVKIQGGHFILIHLKMTGQLVYSVKEEIIAGGHSFKKGNLKKTIGGELPNKHTRFELEFFGGGKLFFNDLRRFGYVKIVSAQDWELIRAGYGIEPLQKNFTLKNLKEIFQSKKNIKAALLDQKNIAGIGNIYADEILFASGIEPRRSAVGLGDDEIKKIFLTTKKIIASAIKHRGTTFSDYIDTRGQKGNFSALLKVYGRVGEKCLICGEKIEKAKIAGRGTHFCPRCQI